MAKRKDTPPTDETGDKTVVPFEAKAAETTAQSDTPPAKTELPSIELSGPEPRPMPKVESPRLVPDLQDNRPPSAAARPQAEKPPPAAKGAETNGEPRLSAAARGGRFALLAACVAVAAATGAIAGVLGASTLGQLLAPAAPAVAADDVRALKDSISRLASDLGALKASAESTNRLTNAQFTRLGEKIDRTERAQSEPATRIAKIAESVERLERRPTPPAGPPPEVTGSIPEPKPGEGLGVGKSAIVEGWVLRDIYRGRALVEGLRSGVIFEVGPGSTIPGLGRVETITRQDGRWMVVTPKGLIVSMR